MEKSRLQKQCISQIKFLVFIAVLTLLSISFKLALALGNETDRLALLALKDQLAADGGNFSGALIPWNSSLHFCEWQGVRCGRKHQRVISLELISMKLGGSISLSIGNLSFLRVVNLSDNSLQGIIPTEFGHLGQLRFLNLSHNHLQGNIPAELSNCSKLQLINLNNNQLTGKIPFFGLADSDLKNLIGLSLAENNLTGGIPSSLGNLSSLDYLQLVSNHLEGIIPDDLGRIPNLKKLLISQNNLSGTIPASVYNISSMTYIGMAINMLSGGLSPEIGFVFPKLEILHIGGNQLSGTIPRSITNISSLEQFDIFGNNFRGLIPENMGNLKNLDLLAIDFNLLGTGKEGDLDFLSSLTNCSLLKLLAINENRLGGALPHSIANLSTQLELLFMGGNRISGSIPEGIGNLFNLRQIHIRGDFITGNMPSSIGKLQNLEGFDFSENLLSGKIPSFGNLSLLSNIYLNDNNLEGRVPLTLSKCQNMQFLYLSNNKLGGSIPDQLIAAFESLIVLNLSHNFFIGIFPSGIGKSKNLEELCVDGNNFSGEIPEELGEISSLRILHMQGNHFQGGIPLSFGSLRGLENLDLSRNNLSGTIPVKLQELPFLVSLNLSFNQLEGEVPRERVFTNSTGLSIIGNKKLCGGIPELELPKCFNQLKILSTKVILVIILSISLASILVVLFVILCWRKRSRRGIIPISLRRVGYLRISYKELLQATNFFASSNLIGEGGFGTVYKGILPRHEKPIAVKVLNLQILGAIKSFMVECEALRNIRHQNLVKVITCCSSINYQGSDFKALVLEFMPNGSLDSWLHYDHQFGSSHLNFDQMLDIAIDVANALDYLHHHCETLIVHRDLKPSNVLLDDDMTAHVSDFGMAKLLSKAATEQASSSVVSGTIGYVAPEYGMGGPTSPEGDIYSYGILLLEMITGKRPTDELFHDGLSLHNFCKMAIPEQLEEILDVRLLQQNNFEKSQKHRGELNIDGDIWDCLISFTQIGVACSVEVPIERMKIQDAVTQLHAIKARLHARNQVVVSDACDDNFTY